MECYLSSKCEEIVDIVLFSSDEKEFGAHKMHLEFYSDGFPPAELALCLGCETVPLTEDSSTLHLLLQFMHKRHGYPDLTNVLFDTLLKLSEAAVKYQVYGAIESCKQHLSRSAKGNITDLNSFDLLVFAVKHGYTDLANEVAPRTLGRYPVHKAVQQYFSMPDLIVPWVRYHASYESIALWIIVNDPPVFGGLHKGVSSDEKQFGAHKRYLEFFSEEFPPADLSSRKICESVQIPEDSTVLDLMLRFMHRNQRHPDLSGVSIRTLLKLSEAVEKYEFFGALELCKQHLLRIANSNNLTGENSIDVLAYAIKHDHRDLADRAARKAVVSSHRLYQVVEDYQNMPDLIVPWARYHTAYQNIAISIMCHRLSVTGLHKGGIEDCEEWITFYNCVRGQFNFQLDKLFKFQEICNAWEKELELCAGGQCRQRASRWQDEICTKLEKIPKFSDIMKYDVENNRTFSDLKTSSRIHQSDHCFDFDTTIEHIQHSSAISVMDEERIARHVTQTIKKLLKEAGLKKTLETLSTSAEALQNDSAANSVEASEILNDISMNIYHLRVFVQSTIDTFTPFVKLLLLSVIVFFMVFTYKLWTREEAGGGETKTIHLLIDGVPRPRLRRRRKAIQ
ncbi:hypothetical protein BDQ17DRAFT_1438373 [Cyathus striatus]|nr:hypothetical protein BDQ17DRAFT_1438373 [Cyathus striatus]